MDEPIKLCAKCGDEMQPGFVLDRAHGSQLPAEWYADPIEKSWWVGVKTAGKEHHIIHSYRCSRCGYLEFYAN